jgi:hypothetical protein
VTRLKYPHLAATRIYRSAPVLRLFRPRSGAARRTFHRYALLQRSKARGLPSVASPFAGTSVHRTLVFIRLLTPVSALGRAFQRCAFLLRLKARGAPSVARPLGGTAIHRISVFSGLALSAPPCGALPGAAARLHQSPVADTGEPRMA